MFSMEITERRLPCEEPGGRHGGFLNSVQFFQCLCTEVTGNCSSSPPSLAAALEAVKAAAAVGKSVAELCELGDSTIAEKLQSVYKGKKIEKGLAFPTCISVREPPAL